MKKFLLLALVMVFLVSASLVGVFLYKNSGDRRFAAEKGEKIEVGSEKIEDKGGKGVDTKLANYLLTPGPVKRRYGSKEVVTSVNGRFIKLEDIPNSKDKYLLLDGVESKYSKLRIVGEKRPEEGLDYVTQLSVIGAGSPKGKSISSRLREVGYFDSLSEDEINFILRPNVWLKAILYLRNQAPVTDDQGHYYVLAVSANAL